MVKALTALLENLGLIYGATCDSQLSVTLVLKNLMPSSVTVTHTGKTLMKIWVSDVTAMPENTVLLGSVC